MLYRVWELHPSNNSMAWIPWWGAFESFEEALDCLVRDPDTEDILLSYEEDEIDWVILATDQVPTTHTYQPEDSTILFYDEP